MDALGTAQLTLVLGGLLGQDVTLEGLATFDRATRTGSKALGGAFP